MKLQGLHHIAMITGDARKNVAFYADVRALKTLTPLVNPRTAQRTEVNA
jgi:glyoxalase family protein